MSKLRIIGSAVLLLIASSVCQAETINQKIVTFLEANRGTRVGGGECAHAATEALRVSGGEFMTRELGVDSPGPGDYVWGTLIKVVSSTGGKWSDSDPKAKVMPGDILQYHDTRIVVGRSTMLAPHHTSIVAAVDAAGLPTAIYEQNTNDVRTIQKDSIDITKLDAGWIRIYRPKARHDKMGTYKFTLVNNMPGPQTVNVYSGEQMAGSAALTGANTASSYMMQVIGSSSITARFTLVLSSGSIVRIDNAAAYEIYEGHAGAADIRKLSP